MGLLGLSLLTATASAETVNVILKAGGLEQGNLFNADTQSIFLETNHHVVEIPQAEIETIFNAKTHEHILLSELWHYRQLNSLTINLLSTIVVQPNIEVELVLNPLSTLAVRGGLSYIGGAGPGHAAGFSYRLYPGETAPHGLYLGLRSDVVFETVWSRAMVKFEMGQKYFYKNGFIFGFFFDVGPTVPLGDASGAGALAIIIFGFVGGGVNVGLAF